MFWTEDNKIEWFVSFCQQPFPAPCMMGAVFSVGHRGRFKHVLMILGERTSPHHICMPQGPGCSFGGGAKSTVDRTQIPRWAIHNSVERVPTT